MFESGTTACLVYVNYLATPLNIHPLGQDAREGVAAPVGKEAGQGQVWPRGGLPPPQQEGREAQKCQRQRAGKPRRRGHAGGVGSRIDST